jgi:outer membrane protein assembly factor BamB
VESTQPVLNSVRPRIWPGAVIVALMALAMTVPGMIAPRSTGHFFSIMFGTIGSALAILLWWFFFSRTMRFDRLAIPGLFIAAAIIVGIAFHQNNPMMIAFYGAPFVGVLWVIWLVLSSSLDWATQRTGLVVVIGLGWAFISLLRINTVGADMIPELRWAWTPSSEELYLQELANRKPDLVAKTEVIEATPGDWVAFRGPNRDSKAVGVRIQTDWEKHPPKQVWKHRIGPGWGAFIVIGNRLFTQEQRGENEAIVCYDAAQGTESWSFSVPERFYEAIAGAGPRSTPTFHEGKIYAQGATGKLVCLDASTGKEIWSKDIRTESSAKPPQWGYSGSPLIIDGKVISVAGGTKGKGVVAYDAVTGNPSWANGSVTHSYSSAQEAIIFGTKQILVSSDIGLESFLPADGKLLWKFDWNIPGMNRVVQPAMIAEGQILVGTGVGSEQGTKLIKVTNNSGEWKTETVWTSKALKPYFNDFVTFEGYAFGFNDALFTCINLKDGKAKWKEGRYGHGQVLLLPEQKKLLVISEDGKMVLLDTNPEEHVETGTFKAIEGRTWNHPVVSRGKLYVRNGEEMACFDLAE